MHQADTSRFATAAVRWICAYATPTIDRSDAEIALRALPETNPFEPIFQRASDSNESIGRVYLLAGKPRDAIIPLRRSAYACSAAYPLERVHALEELAEAEEANGDRERACNEYRAVLHHWGRESRAITLRRAQERARAICKW